MSTSALASSALAISALAISSEHRALADAAAGQLSRLDSLATARATLEGGANQAPVIWAAAAELGWNGLAIS